MALTHLALALLPALPAASVDVLSPGHRSIVHELVIEGSAYFDEFDFYAAPTRGFGGVERLSAEEPFRFSSKYGTRIFALPLGGPAPTEPEEAAIQARAVGALPEQQVPSVPVSSPTLSIRSRIRIDGVDGETVQLSLIERKVERDLRILVAVACVFGLGVVGLAMFWRRRRARDAA